MTDKQQTTAVDTAELRRRAVGNMTDRTGRLIEQAADEIDHMRKLLDKWMHAGDLTGAQLAIVIRETEQLLNV